jgi:hypothetical protein
VTLYIEGARFATKKQLKETIAAGRDVYVYSESPFAPTVTPGRHAICGPSAYERKWYAEVEVDSSARIVKVIA